MTSEREAHLGRVITWFNDHATPKYRKGQKEHGGSAWEKSGMFRNLCEEAVDFVVYLETIEEQLRERFPEAYRFLTGDEVVQPKLTRLRPRIYVAGPYTVENDNQQVEYHIKQAASFARKIWVLGGAAFCPHLNTQQFDGPELDWQTFINGDLEWVSVSDAVFLLPGWQNSGGARLEQQRAKALKIPLFENLVSLETWIQQWGH